MERKYNSHVNAFSSKRRANFIEGKKAASGMKHNNKKTNEHRIAATQEFGASNSKRRENEIEID